MEGRPRCHLAACRSTRSIALTLTRIIALTLTLILALTPCSRGTRGDVLLVAFSAQGPGIQQWQAAAVAPLRALGASLDALYLADPSNSYYLQDPGGGWGGIAHFSELVRRESTPSSSTPSTAHWYRALYVCTTLVQPPWHVLVTPRSPHGSALCLFGARQAPRANPHPSPLTPSP